MNPILFAFVTKSSLTLVELFVIKNTLFPSSLNLLKTLEAPGISSWSIHNTPGINQIKYIKILCCLQNSDRIQNILG